MANIFYGVAGEGSGHASRAREVINHLESQGHVVKIASYDRGLKDLRTDYDVVEIFGLNFSHKNNQIQYFPTVLKNLVKLPEASKSINKVLKIFDGFKPDVVISDFEPISGVVANLRKIPLISIDNMHIMIKAGIEYPDKYEKEALAAKAIVRMMLFNAQAYIVTSFFEAKPNNKKTFIFPPILGSDVMRLKPKRGRRILVYLSSEYEKLFDILKEIRAEFIVYGAMSRAKAGNLIFREPSRKGFLNDLAACRGVIANAGFSLISEAIYLKKPYLAIPIKSHFEQILNAYYLEKQGFGKYWDEPDREKIEAFLYNIDYYKSILKEHNIKKVNPLFHKLDQLIDRLAR